MKIALISPHYGPPWNEGVRNMARCLVEFMESKGEKVFVISRKLMAESGGLSAILARIPVLRSIAFNLFAAREAKRCAPDVILALSSLSSGLGVKCFLLQRWADRPLVLYITGLRRWIRGYRVSLNVKKVIVNSPFLCDFFPEAEVIPPVIVSKNFARNGNSGELRSDPVILFLGAFEKCRGVEYLIKAMGELNGRVRGKLILAWNGMGKYRYRQILRTIRGRRLEHKVEIMRTADVGRLYRQASVVVIPRIWPERMAFPLRILEAVTAGIPLIVSRVSGMDQLIEGCGLSVPPRDEKALAEAIERLLSDGDLYRQMSHNCRRKAELWNPERNLEKLYRTIQEERGA